MASRISSEHPSITTIRARVARSGSTQRPELRIPPEDRDAFPMNEVVRLVIGETEYCTRVTDRAGSVRICGAADSPRLARHPADGPNRLVEWLRAENVGVDRSVLVDVVVPGFRYGVRLPGETAVYDTSEPPTASLRRIAADLDE